MVEKLKQLYPGLSSKMEITIDECGTTVKLNFDNPRYELWFTDEGNGSYMVGINFLHSHYDLNSPEDNFKEALKYFGDIVNDQIVAIGIRDKETDFLLCTMSIEDGIEGYGNQRPKVEIVSFTKEYKINE